MRGSPLAEELSEDRQGGSPALAHRYGTTFGCASHPSGATAGERSGTSASRDIPRLCLLTHPLQQTITGGADDAVDKLAIVPIPKRAP